MIPSLKIINHIRVRTMKKVLVGVAAFAALLIAPITSAWANYTYQGVTFTLTDEGGGVLQVEIQNALNATGNWLGVNYLEAFSLLPKSGTITGASVTNVTGWHEDSGGLSNGSSDGCDTHGGGVCFYYTNVSAFTYPNYPTDPYSLSNDMIFDVQFTGTGLDLSSDHLKVDFWKSPQDNCSAGHNPENGAAWSCNATGSLLSVDIPVGVPLPAAGAGLPGLLTVCGGLLVWMRRRRLKLA
jgi:hypothetical protein